ncbi:MAG: hypothetical protein GY913_25845 [Proteobacteria bacterium]|nr:hypothetical protein [Pseudomonadota bacterium]MCP4920339.1 hypothetical protein [Pseudomonadota bacterium]
MRLLRWGRSAYETDAQLADERRRLEALGVEVRAHVGPHPPLDGVDILAVTSKVGVTHDVLASGDDLRLVVTTTSGHEHIDRSACADLGVTVARSPLARRDAVVDTALGLALALLRRTPFLQERAVAGLWARAELPQLGMRTVRSLTVGIVGHGVIGSRAAEVWHALGAQVLVSDPQLGESPSVAELVASCQVLALHCDLNPSSRGLVDAALLRSMAPGTVLTNTARGGLVDADALLEAPHVLAGLDVFPAEPYPRLAELASRPGTLLLPHAAGYHDGLGRAVAQELEQAVAQFLRDGTVPHPV